MLLSLNTFQLPYAVCGTQFQSPFIPTEGSHMYLNFFNITFFFFKVTS